MATVNLKQRKQGEPSCLSCKFFSSWCDVYEDPDEDWETGLCNQPGGKIDEPIVGIDYNCDKFEKKELLKSL